MTMNPEMFRMATTRMTATEMSALLLLISIADDEGIAVATLDQIAEAIGYNRAGVAASLRSLVAAERLVKVKRGVYRIPPKVAKARSVWARDVQDEGEAVTTGG